MNKSHLHRLICSASLFIFILALTSSAAADDGQTLQIFLEKVRKSSAKIQSFSCNFTQERHLSLFPEAVVFRGNLKLIRPDRLRWAFVSPIPSVLIFNGNKGIRCTDNQQPVLFELESDPVMRIVAKQLWSWLNNDYDDLKDQYIIQRSGTSSLTITPADKSSTEFIGSVIITFDEKSYQPKRVVINEPDGDSTHIVFSNYQFDIDLAKSTFTTCSQND